MSTQPPSSTFAESNTPEPTSLKELQFRSRFDKMAKPRPRFLLRKWSSASGSDSRCNTPDAITPDGFLDGHKSESMFRMPPSMVHQIADAHVQGVHTHNTVFSSWTQSLSTICDLLDMEEEKLARDKHVSILDTTKLSEANVVMHTSDVANIMGRIGTNNYHHEYLIFGVVQGPGYKAVPESDLLSCQELEHGSPSFEDMLEMAQLFGEDLAPPMAAFMMAHSTTRSEETCDEYLFRFAQALKIPIDWFNEETIMNPQVDYHGFDQAKLAETFLQRMVTEKHASLGQAQKQETEQMNL